VGVALFFVTEKVESPPPTPARMGMVLCWVLVYSGGHERCRWCGLGASVAGGLVSGRRSQSGRCFGGHRLALNLNLGGAALWTNLNL
jgi:hypothetical protein